MHRVVVAALLRPRAEVLLCYRSPARRWYPAVWDFPGGHVETDETPLIALCREVREEVGVEVDIGALDELPDLRVQEDDLDLSLWAVHTWDGEPVNRAPDEHDRIEWFDVDRAMVLELAHLGYRSWLARLIAAG